MSLLNFLQFQEIDELQDDTSEDHQPQDDINLEEPLDDSLLENFWDQVVDDIHQDPDWFTFNDD
jgi:hypothetical protein